MSAGRDFEELLSSARAELGRVAARPTGSAPTPPDKGVGHALDGRVVAEMGADGRLTGLTLDPSVMRMDERMLAREIMTAVNLAWAARQGADETDAAVAAIDPAALGQRLTELQDQGLATMRRFTDGMQAVLDRLEARVPR